MTDIERDFKEAIFDAGEVEINFAEGPDNGPPVLLIHGIGGFWHQFLSVCELIYDRWHVYAVDLRGHGKSGHTTTGYDFTDYPRDVVALVQEILGAPPVIWRTSLGAPTTLGVAVEIPDLVSAAILEDPPMMIEASPATSQLRPNFLRTHDLIVQQPPDDEVLAVLREIGPGDTEEGYQRRLQAIRRNDPAIYDRIVEGRGSPKWDPEAVLSAMTPPTLLMQADPEVGAAVQDEHAETAMGLLRNAQLEKFPGVGHGIHAAVPQQTVDLVERFVSERA